jgi:signal transduction histidine kinase
VSDTLKILLIEDNPGDARLIVESLAEAQGMTFELELAGRLSTGLERLAQGDIDAVLLDLSLPDSQGLDTLAQVQARALGAPIIVSTGLDDASAAIEAVRRGAQDYLVKGRLDGDRLARSIRYAVERKQGEETLRRYAAELKVRNEELDAFAHTVAHDLKSLASVVVGFAETLASEGVGMPEEELRQYLRIMAQNGRKMSNVIDALLLLARVRKMEAHVQPLDMASIVTEAQQRLATLIGEYQAQIIVPDTWPVALGYGPWVEEVWVNYLSNAIKYGGRPPRVELGADLVAMDPRRAEGAERESVRFWVRDNGPGLTPEQRARLFTPLVRLDQVEIKGHGLGLAIVRGIVEKMGGQVQVTSQVGQGSVFAFILPGSLTDASRPVV